MGILFNIYESKEELSFKDDKDLYNYMNKNIKYANYTKLKSAQEVLRSKSGSCHDQVMFELYYLRKMGYSPKGLFIIEYNDNNQGGQTHSLLFYTNTNKKIIWFENAWYDMKGIHEFNSLKELKDKIKDLHKTGKLGNINKFPYLEIRSLKHHNPGETLNEFVSLNL